MTDQTNHGVLLATRLKAIGLKQSQLATMCGVSPRAVYNWIHNRAEVPVYCWSLVELVEAIQAGMKRVRLAAGVGR